MTQLEAESAGGLTVFDVAAVPGAADARATLVADGVPARLTAKDATLWGPEAESEAAVRLGWLDTFRGSRELPGRLARLRAELAGEGLDHVVLAGMGGSSLAPEVITRTLGIDLTILDTTDPHQVRRALADRLDRTVVVVASKSGGTIETDSHRRVYRQAFLDAGVPAAEVGRRFVVVTDPGSPLEETAKGDGARAVFLADPEVGGRYSALTAFGLVPSALAGVNVSDLLAEADALAESLAGDTHNPALALGSALAAAANAGRDKVVLVSDGTGIVGLGDWIEQLIAESTGKDGKGILPVVIEDPASPGVAGDDVLLASIGGAVGPDHLPGAGLRPFFAVNGPLGAHFLTWEYATAVAGRLLGINPFDQPNVAESKNNTQRMLSDGIPQVAPNFVDGAVEVYADRRLLGTTGDLAGALSALLHNQPRHGYLAVMAYLDRVGDAEAAQLRPLLARNSTQPVTFGWGPRFLHSTGQYHKGGPPNGVFLQITGAVTDDLPVPGRPYTLGGLQAAQAAGDRQALTERDLPLVRLHLTDRRAGLAQVLAATRELGSPR